MFCANQSRITGGFGGRAKVLQTSVFPYGFYIKTCKGKTQGGWGMCCIPNSRALQSLFSKKFYQTV